MMKINEIQYSEKTSASALLPLLGCGVWPPEPRLGGGTAFPPPGSGTGFAISEAMRYQGLF
jgi:hypothetical protein